jgi:FkbM family methyltransferase
MSEFKHNWINQFFTNEKLVIFDIGAYNFEDSIIFKNKFKNSEVYAFEASSVNYNTFHKNADINGVLTFNIALSNKIGKSTFFRSVSLNGMNWGASGSLLEPSDKLLKRIQFESDLEIETTTIEDFCKTHNIPNIDIIHMDVQGAEDLVIEGGMDFLTNHTRYLYTEFSNIELYEEALTKEGICSLLPDYEIVGLFNTNYMWFGDMLMRNKKFIGK